MTFYASASSNHCCGVLEIGSFDEDWATRGDTPQELLENIYKDAKIGTGQYGGGAFMYHIWFVKRRNFDGSAFDRSYEYSELRDYVKTIPGVIHLGKSINPNTGNRIDGYCFKEPE